LAGTEYSDSSFRAWSTNIKCIYFVLWLCLIGNAAMPTALIAAQARATPAAPDQPIAFDLPTQALEAAIEAYSVTTGWQIVYDAGLASGRQSASVKGQMPPAAALRRLLDGTGLIADFMAADGAMLVPDPSAQYTSPLEPDPHLRDYYGRIQTGLKRAFCADERIRSGGYRIAIGFWIGGSGTVARVMPLGSTGQPDIDVAFVHTVSRLSFGQAPPAGFEQPIVTLVTPELLAQCDAPRVQSARAAR
jgi:hypothetical protein